MESVSSILQLKEYGALKQAISMCIVSNGGMVDHFPDGSAADVIITPYEPTTPASTPTKSSATSMPVGGSATCAIVSPASVVAIAEQPLDR